MTAANLILWRQIANNYLLVMDFVLDGILLLYIASYVRASGTAAWSLVRVRAATWMGIHVIGLTLQRAWGVVLLRAIARGQDVAALEAHVPLFFAGSMIAVIGLAGTIYTFTPLAGQEHPSLLKRSLPLAMSIIVATLFTIVMHGV